MAAGPVYTLDALVPIDDLEDLTDECTGLLSSILVQGRKRAQLLATIRAPLLPQRQCEPALRHPPQTPLSQFKTFPRKIIWLLSCSYDPSMELKGDSDPSTIKVHFRFPGDSWPIMKFICHRVCLIYCTGAADEVQGGDGTLQESKYYVQCC